MSAFKKSSIAALADTEKEKRDEQREEERKMEQWQAVQEVQDLLDNEDSREVIFGLMTHPFTAETLEASMRILSDSSYWFAIIRNFTLDSDSLWVIYRDVCFGQIFSPAPRILHHLLDHPAMTLEMYDRLLEMTINSETSNPSIDTCVAFLISRHAEHGGRDVVMDRLQQGRFVSGDPVLLEGRANPRDPARLLVPEPMLSREMIESLMELDWDGNAKDIYRCLIVHPNMNPDFRREVLQHPDSPDRMIWAILGCERLPAEEVAFIQKKVNDDQDFRRRHGFALALSGMNDDARLLELCGLFRADMMSDPKSRESADGFFGAVLVREGVNAEVFNTAYAAMLDLNQYGACSNFFADPRLDRKLRQRMLAWHIRNHEKFPTSWFHAQNLSDPEAVMLSNSVHTRSPSEQMAIVKGLKPSPTTPRMLRLLSTSSHFDVREVVAGHREADAEMLFTLSQDPEEQVRSVVAQRKDIPENAQRFLAHDRAYGVRKLLLKNPEISANTVFLLAHDGNHHIRRLVLSHPMISPDLATMLTKDVREEVAREAQAVIARRWPRTRVVL